MPQVKIYGRRSTLEGRIPAISDAIEASMAETIAVPPGRKYQRFLPMDDACFYDPDGPQSGLLVVEVQMMVGRSREARQRLIHALMDRVAAAAGTHRNAVEVILQEVPKENWGLRGTTGDLLDLGYKTNV